MLPEASYIRGPFHQWFFTAASTLVLNIDARYEMFNCLVEAAVQQAYNECGCYPGYLVLSNNTCYGDSLRCFKRVFYYLGIVLKHW